MEKEKKQNTAFAVIQKPKNLRFFMASTESMFRLSGDAYKLHTLLLSNDYSKYKLNLSNEFKKLSWSNSKGYRVVQELKEKDYVKIERKSGGKNSFYYRYYIKFEAYMIADTELIEETKKNTEEVKMLDTIFKQSTPQPQPQPQVNVVPQQINTTQPIDNINYQTSEINNQNTTITKEELGEKISEYYKEEFVKNKTEQLYNIFANKLRKYIDEDLKKIAEGEFNKHQLLSEEEKLYRKVSKNWSKDEKLLFRLCGQNNINNVEYYNKLKNRVNKMGANPINLVNNTIAKVSPNIYMDYNTFKKYFSVYNDTIAKQLYEDKTLKTEREIELKRIQITKQK